MISYKEALQLILDSGKANDSQSATLAESIEHICGENITSSEIVPSFANSAMDGYAVVTTETAAACKENPTSLKVISGIAAGDEPFKGKKATDAAIQIMTGAPVPEFCDGIIRIEDVQISNDGKTITIFRPVAVGENIRDSGEDFKIGDKVIEAGTKIMPQQVMALASLGIYKIRVIPKPQVAIIITGKELSDNAAQPLKAGQIRNSNGPYLSAALPFLGADVVSYQSITDDPKVFQQSLQILQTKKPAIIISTGAVSMGQYDFIPDELQKAGASILFHKSAIKPGKPLLFAKLPNGGFYFGLPGNPLSAAVGLRFFVYPLIRKLQGLSEEYLPRAILTEGIRKKENLRVFLKANASANSTGQLRVDILAGQESFKVHSLLQANCWAILPEGTSEVKGGDAVAFAPLYPDNFTYKTNGTICR